MMQAAFSLFLTTAFVLAAQDPLTLEQAVHAAVAQYPSIRVSQEQMNAASAGIMLARTAYLPRIDTIAQVNRATRNNVFGLLLPQSLMPSISGPVIGSNNLGSVWGTAVGGLVSWEPFDFGFRSAGVAAAEASKARSEATLKRTQFEVAVAAADACLTIVAAEETIRAAQAGVARAEEIARITGALVNQELRPGADQSRAEAEIAAAKTAWIQAQQASDVAKANLAQFTGGEPASIHLTAGALLQMPPKVEVQPLNPDANPILVEQAATVEQTRAELRILERSYFPKFNLQAAAYTRGTGAETDGTRLGGLNGLAPNVQNYSVGLTVTFPVLDLFAIHAREAAQSSLVKSQIARSQQLATDLRAQWNRAVAMLNGARRIVENTPIQVSAARKALEQATARYRSGLGNVADVADSQRLLEQAEIDDALARLNIWRALLSVAAAAGDIQPFLAEASK